MSVTSSELHYESVQPNYGTYSYRRITPEAGTGSISFNATAPDRTVFSIPPNIVNFARCSVSFTLKVTGTAAKRTRLWCCGFPFARNIYLTKPGSFDIVRINNVNKYMRAYGPRVRSKHDLQIRGPAGTATLSNPATGASTTGVTTLSKSVPTLTYSSTNPTTSVDTNGYALYADVGADADAVDQTLLFDIPLSEIYESALALDKDIRYSNEPINLVIEWEGTAFVGYQSATTVTTVAFDQAIPDGTCTMTNLVLNLAVETNPEAQAVAMSVRELDIPWVEGVIKTTSSGAGAYTVEVIYHRSIVGRKLRKVIIAPYSATNSGATVFDLCNLTSALVVTKVSALYTLLDGNRLHPQNLAITQLTAYDDFALQKKQNSDLGCCSTLIPFQQNWVWVQDFTGGNLDIVGIVDDGYPIQTSVTYTANFTQLADLSYHVFALTTRKLVWVNGEALLT